MRIPIGLEAKSDFAIEIDTERENREKLRRLAK